MSEVERNKGRLIPTDIDTEHFTDDNWDDVYSEGMVCIDGELYTVEWEVESEIDYDFVEVKENADGSIDFHTMHYNGGAHWAEVVEHKLNERK